MGGHYWYGGHRESCPLPGWTREQDNAVYDDGGWTVPVRCIEQRGYELGYVGVWFSYPHTNPCLICARALTREDAQHVTFAVVFLDRVREGSPSELDSQERPITHPTMQWFTRYPLTDDANERVPNILFGEGPMRVRDLNAEVAFADADTEVSSAADASDTDMESAPPAAAHTGGATAAHEGLHSQHESSSSEVEAELESLEDSDDGSGGATSGEAAA